MAATGVRCTMIFRDGALAITETHVWTNATTIADTMLPFQALVKKRVTLNANGVVLVKGRLSKEGVKRDSRILPAAFLALQGAGGAPIGDPGGVALDANPDQPKACYRLICFATDLHQTNLYLGGIPDYVCRFDANARPVAPPPQWQLNLDAYIAELLKGWGYVGRAQLEGALAPRPVVKLSTNMDSGLLQVVTAVAGAPYSVGQKVQMHDFKLTNNAFVPINGDWQIDAVETDAPSAGFIRYTLRLSASVNPATVSVLGSIAPIDFTTYKYDGIEPVGPTTRKRGNRQLAPVGKRLIRRRIAG